MSEIAQAGQDGVGDDVSTGDDALRREQYFFTLYRMLVAALFALVAFGSLPDDWVTLSRPGLAAGVAAAYLVCSLLLLLHGRRQDRPLFGQVVAGVVLDILATVLMVHSVTHLQTGIAMALIVTFGAAAVLLPLRTTLVLAIAAGLLLLVEYALARMGTGLDRRSLIEILVCALGYLAMTKLGDMMGRQMRETHVLAEQRGAEVESLAQINELVIRRMRTGVLVVDVAGIVHLHNEAAWHLLGQPDTDRLVLGDVATELAQRLFQWRMGDERNGDKPIHLGPDLPDIIPRFAGLGASNELFVIFLDDTSLVSRRAEELTLANLGRLSASIAHEIRNPLAAISYSAQLLEESPDLPDADRRLVEIVLNHCQRMNGIIENVLNLSRRERSRPESIDAAQWVLRFVEEYRTNHYIESTQLKAASQGRHLNAMVDPQQLDQVVSCLVQNAINHGHLPGESARITVAARRLGENGPTVIEVLDRGPGIPPKVAETIFEPFVTTHEHGTGLGLYIARQLCDANQAKLEYVPMAGGSCFRITLAHAQRLENLPGMRHSAIAR
ncbi:ATP-binding protein [Xanthomonadaceae bacterium JHOS43]|nr:ATP-binding protein [Xanthomonadaceae bacterium JHOS43]MCX7563410.1 ATP-binding protein [Xanthomonadaceae bacterium XH05]